MWFKYFVFNPDNDSFRIETCSNAELRSLNRVLSDWRIMFYFYMHFNIYFFQNVKAVSSGK